MSSTSASSSRSSPNANNQQYRPSQPPPQQPHSQPQQLLNQQQHPHSAQELRNGFDLDLGTFQSHTQASQADQHGFLPMNYSTNFLSSDPLSQNEFMFPHMTNNVPVSQQQPEQTSHSALYAEQQQRQSQTAPQVNSSQQVLQHQHQQMRQQQLQQRQRIQQLQIQQQQQQRSALLNTRDPQSQNNGMTSYQTSFQDYTNVNVPSYIETNDSFLIPPVVKREDEIDIYHDLSPRNTTNIGVDYNKSAQHSVHETNITPNNQTQLIGSNQSLESHNDSVSSCNSNKSVHSEHSIHDTIASNNTHTHDSGNNNIPLDFHNYDSNFLLSDLKDTKSDLNTNTNSSSVNTTFQVPALPLGFTAGNSNGSNELNISIEEPIDMVRAHPEISSKRKRAPRKRLTPYQKQAHNKIEKRYRININTKIAKLQQIIPWVSSEQTAFEVSDMLKKREMEMGNINENNRSHANFIDTGAPSVPGSSPSSIATITYSPPRSSSTSANSTKLNKSMILEKAVDYILYLQNNERLYEMEVQRLKAEIEALKKI